MFTEKQLDLMKKPTPTEWLEKFTLANGFEATGVNFNKARKYYNEIFGVGCWHSSFDANSARVETKGKWTHASVKVTVSVKDTLGNWSWTNETMGSMSLSNVPAYGDALKAAIADGIKKNFSFLGIFDDVYSGETVEPVVVSEINTDEDKEEASKLVGEITAVCQRMIEFVKSIDVEKNPPTPAQKKIAKMYSKKGMKGFYEVFTQILHKTKIDGGAVTMALNDKIESAESFKSIGDLKIILEQINKWHKKVTDGA